MEQDIKFLKKHHKNIETYREILESNEAILSGYKFYLRELPQKEIAERFYYLQIFNNFITEYQEKRFEDVAEVDFVFFFFEWFIKFYSKKDKKDEAEKIITVIYKFYKYLQKIGKVSNITPIKNITEHKNTLLNRIESFYKLDMSSENYMNDLKKWTLDIYRIWDDLEELYLR